MTMATYTESCPPQSLGAYHMLFNQLILGLLNSSCDITPRYPKDADLHILHSTRFDFIVIGAGSSGSVIANRLTEIREWKVLLIEAGDNPPIEAEIPGFLQSTWYSPATDYMYFANKSPSLCRGFVDGRCFLPRAKMLGGCSSHNYMTYGRGSYHDYNRWAEAGNKGWDYGSVLPYFKKLENIGVKSLRNAEHGTSGPQYLGWYPNSTHEPVIEAQQTIYRAAMEAGMPLVEDIGVHTVTGIGRLLSTIKDGERDNTARAYLSPIRNRPNLFLLKRAYVTKIHIDSHKRAYGVRIFKNHRYFDISALKEVIVSAGTINSPHLLMLSGVGPAEHLSKFGVKTVRDLKVGYNLRDHCVFSGAIFTYNSAGFKPQKGTDVLYEYLTTRTGDLADPAGLSAEIYYDSTGKMPDYPDIQITLTSAEIYSSMHSSGYKPEIAQQLFSGVQNDSVVVYAYVTSLRPGIHGRVSLKSANPFDAPRIDLDDPKDPKLQQRRTRAILAGIELLERMNRTESLRNKGIILQKPYIKGCRGSWDCIIPYFLASFYHFAGTNKMGPKTDPEAVVDPTLKVHGVKGLRVVDASIMPNVVASYINIPCMMIGEKAADMIKEEYGCR